MLLTFCLWDQLKYESSKFDMDWYQPWREIDPLRRSDFIYSKKNWLDTFVYVTEILW